MKSNHSTSRLCRWIADCWDPLRRPRIGLLRDPGGFWPRSSPRVALNPVTRSSVPPPLERESGRSVSYTSRISTSDFAPLQRSGLIDGVGSRFQDSRLHMNSAVILATLLTITFASSPRTA